MSVSSLFASKIRQQMQKAEDPQSSTPGTPASKLTSRLDKLRGPVVEGRGRVKSFMSAVRLAASEQSSADAEPADGESEGDHTEAAAATPAATAVAEKTATTAASETAAEAAAETAATVLSEKPSLQVARPIHGLPLPKPTSNNIRATHAPHFLEWPVSVPVLVCLLL